jgi:transcriptional regulator with XRE-family HTH domain
MKFAVNSDNALRMSHLERRMLVALRIKDLRENSGFSQRDIAKELHISQSTYCRLERGEVEPSAIQLATLSTLYNHSVLWLLGVPSFIAFPD